MYVCSLLDDNNVLVIRGTNHRKYSLFFLSVRLHVVAIKTKTELSVYGVLTCQSTLLSPPSEDITVLMLLQGRVNLIAWGFTDKPDWQTKRK